MSETFAARVLRWFDAHGRRHLPWQQDPTPYRVWISEIMLQQTQVAAVIPYYERFMQRFPGVAALAEAQEDEVLHHWSGLGYYARARNLHASAKRIRDDFNGEFPRAFADVAALPGIGRSTAGAILSLADGQRHPILDGNVKRVLARHAAIEGWPGRSAVLDALWRLAAERLPQERPGAYNQAMMDIGATICTRGKPDCASCPVAADCIAFRESRQADLPASKPRAPVPERNIDMLLLMHHGCVLLHKRPPAGVWGGLWSFPETENAEHWLAEHGVKAEATDALERITHTFSHFRLHIRPVRIELRSPVAVSDGESGWYDAASLPELGLAAPVQRILQMLAQHAATATDNGEHDGTHG